MFASVCVQASTQPGLPTAERADGEVVWRQTSAVVPNESHTQIRLLLLAGITLKKLLLVLC